MLASAHFRREGVGPGCSDSPGPPGACPTQAATAAAAATAALCCLRTPRALHVGTAKTEQEDVTAGSTCSERALCVPRSTVFMIPARNIVFHFSILGEINPFPQFFFNEDPGFF